MNLIKFLKQYQADVILALAVILISVTAFNLGRISALNKQKAQITITQPESRIQNLGSNQKSEPVNSLNAGPVIASKNSSGKLYHFPWCSSASKIADKNKITFATETAAISAGYTLAGNCQK